jgi:hypothetical protein
LTVGSEPTHNHRVPARVLRVFVAMALLPWQLVPVYIGQEHRHAPDEDHPNSVVHRHLQPHHDDADDRDHRLLAVDEDHVQWIAPGVLNQPEYQLAGSVATPNEGFVLARPEDPGAAAVEFLAPPSHGPPRSVESLRGPPYLSS